MSFTTLTKVGQGNGSSDLRYDFTGTSLQKTDIQVTVIENSTSWDSFSSYSTNAERSYNGNLYKATSSISAGQNPPIHTTGTTNNWQFLRATSIAKNLNTHYTIPTYNTTNGGTVEFIAGSDNGLTSRGFPAGSTTQVFTVRVARVTSSNPIVEFAAGSSIKADDLNKQNKQALFVGEDTREAVNSLAIGDPQSAFQVNGSNIVANSITTGKIDNGAIITEDLANGAVTNLKVSSTAAIDGTKISPNFGSQNIVTTGTLGTGNATLGDITISTTAPSIKFDESDQTTDYFIVANNNTLTLARNNLNTPNHIQKWNADGHVDFLTNVDFASGIDVTGTCTATTFSGSGASLTDLPAANITAGGTLPALNASNLTNLPLAAKIAFFGIQNAAQSIAAHSSGFITLTNFSDSAVTLNTGTSWNATTGIFTVGAGQAGTYEFIGMVRIGGQHRLEAPAIGISKNDATPTYFADELARYNSSSSPTFEVTAGPIIQMMTLAVGDTVRLKVRNGTGSAENTIADRTSFSGRRISE